MLDVGPASIPAILNAIVDQALNLSDLSQVWDVHWIVDDRLRGWTSHADVDLILSEKDAISSLTLTKISYSRLIIFSSAPRIVFSISFNSGVMYLSQFTRVCFLI